MVFSCCAKQRRCKCSLGGGLGIWGFEICVARCRLTDNEFWLDFLKRVVSLGAGEVLLNSVEKDGTLSGPDLSIIQDASCNVGVPLIALGGISNLEDVKACVDVGASAGLSGGEYLAMISIAF